MTTSKRGEKRLGKAAEQDEREIIKTQFGGRQTAGRRRRLFLASPKRGGSVGA